MSGGTDLKHSRNRTNRLASVSKRAFANIFRIESCHPCWPPFSSMEFESEIPPNGNPNSGKKHHALVGKLDPFESNKFKNLSRRSASGQAQCYSADALAKSVMCRAISSGDSRGDRCPVPGNT